MVTKAWKVWGENGKKQSESFNESMILNLESCRDSVYTLYVENADATGTNDYTIIRIVADTEVDCDDEFHGQLSDGVFENSSYGLIETIYCIEHE